MPHKETSGVGEGRLAERPTCAKAQRQERTSSDSSLGFWGPRGTLVAWGVGAHPSRAQLIPGSSLACPLAPCRQAPSLRMAWM